MHKSGHSHKPDRIIILAKFVVLAKVVSHTNIIEPRHEISNNVVCAISKASDQPYAQSDQSLYLSLEYSMIVKPLTEHYLECLHLKGGCTGWSESTHVKMLHCWKSHVAAHMITIFLL